MAQPEHIEAIEKWLWNAADTMRANSNYASNEYFLTHIFFVYSLLNTKIVAAGKFEQLFVSTHNLDFLKYLKRLKGSKRIKEQFSALLRSIGAVETVAVQQ